MKLKIGKNEFNIEFAFKPTLKARVLSKLARIEQGLKNDDGAAEMEVIEDLLMFLPELLLAGLQKHHEDYRYNYDTEDGKEEQLDKTFDLIEEYSESENASYIQLFQDMEEEMLQNSFLKRVFQEEQKKAQEKAKKTES